MAQTGTQAPEALLSEFDWYQAVAAHELNIAVQRTLDGSVAADEVAVGRSLSFGLSLIPVVDLIKDPQEAGLSGRRSQTFTLEESQLANVVPIQALVVGVAALVVGAFLVPRVRSGFVEAQQDLTKSTERYERTGRFKPFTKAAKTAVPVMTRANDLVAMAFQWLCIGVGAFAMLCYVIGFFGINLAEIILK